MAKGRRVAGGLPKQPTIARSAADSSPAARITIGWRRRKTSTPRANEAAEPSFWHEACVRERMEALQYLRKTLLIRAGLLLVIATLAACETAPRWGQRPPPAQPAQAPAPAPTHIALSEQIDARQGEIDSRIEAHFRA